MPNKPKCHAEMQKSVCLMCFRKPKTLRKITPRTLTMFQNLVLSDYGAKEQWDWLPSVICAGCYSELNRGTENSNYTIKHIDYESLERPPEEIRGAVTRNRMLEEASERCFCSVCKIGRLSGGSYNEYKVSVSEPTGRPRTKEISSDPGPITVCSECLNSYGKGLPHNCVKSAKRENLEDLVRASSPKTKERLLSSQLKEHFESKGVSTRGGQITLTTGGTPIQAILGQPKTKQRPPPKFCNDTLNRLQLSLGISDNKMKLVDNFLRMGCGRDAVVKHEEHMKETNNKLENLFEIKKIIQQKYEDDVEEKSENNVKKKKIQKLIEVEKTVVCARDVEELACFIMEERNLSPEDSSAQVGIDVGQGLIKFMLTVKRKEKDNKQKGKKMKYNEGFQFNQFKLSGVKKLLVLLVSPTIETYENIAGLMGELRLDAVDFGYSCDLKMILLLCGKQSASSKYCCPFCTDCAPWTGSLSTKEQELSDCSKAGVPGSSKILASEACGSSEVLSTKPSTIVRPVTIGSLWSDYSNFQTSGGNIRNAMKYNNVVNVPLITGQESEKVLGLVNFPELHVLTGITGKLVKEFENKVFSSSEEGHSFMNQWMELPSVSVQRCVYRGQAGFVGNEAMKLLRKAPKSLAEKVKTELGSDTADKAAPYIIAFHQLHQVVEACFGQDLDSSYTTKIKDFMKTYRSLGISIPLKVHLLESHLEEFLKIHSEKYGAGYYSEQAMESCHKDFKVEWDTCKVNESHEDYGRKLKRTTVRYNGKHI